MELDDPGFHHSVLADFTGSTHVLAAVRDLTWLELVTEAVRAGLEGVAGTAPHLLEELVGEEGAPLRPPGPPGQEPHIRFSGSFGWTGRSSARCTSLRADDSARTTVPPPTATSLTVRTQHPPRASRVKSWYVRVGHWVHNDGFTFFVLLYLPSTVSSGRPNCGAAMEILETHGQGWGGLARTRPA